MKKSALSIIKLVSSTAVLSAILIISNSCSKSTYNNNTGTTGGTGGTGGPGTNEVLIQGMAFSPSTITVSTNTTVTWTNKDAIGHTVTSDSGLFDSGTVATNGSFTYTFATAGTFTYHCKIHPTMTGSVVVTAPVSTPGY